jgi:hypothetical protein
VYIPHPEQYHALATSEDRPAPAARRDSNPLSNSQTWRNKLKAPRNGQGEAGKSPFPSLQMLLSFHLVESAANTKTATTEEALPASESQDSGVADEASSLLSTPDSEGPGDVESEDGDDKHASVHHHHSHRADISGFKLLGKPEFYSLWVMLGILTGIGLMTINNIGNDVCSILRCLSHATHQETRLTFSVTQRHKPCGTPTMAKPRNSSSCNAN